MNVVYNMDCMDGMKDYPDNHFELAIVDPPYGIKSEKGTNAKMGLYKSNAWTEPSKTYKYDIIKEWDKTAPKKQYFMELKRISQNLIIWGGNYFTDYLPPNNGWIVWDKKTTNKIFSPFEMAWTSFSKPRIFRFLMEGYKKEKQEDYRFGRIHPTQKPQTMYKWLLQNYAKPGDKILDTHVGSGSSRIACHEMGFDFTGYEIDKDYFDAQEERFYHATRQKELFNVSL